MSCFPSAANCLLTSGSLPRQCEQRPEGSGIWENSLKAVTFSCGNAFRVPHRLQIIASPYRSWKGPQPNGLRLSCGPPAPQTKKMASTGRSARGGASGPTASSAG